MKEKPDSAETIALLRSERERPNFWIHLTDGEVYALLAGVVLESVKVACYDATEEAFAAKLQLNAQKPDAATKTAAKKAKAQNDLPSEISF